MIERGASRATAKSDCARASSDYAAACCDDFFEHLHLLRLLNFELFAFRYVGEQMANVF